MKEEWFSIWNTILTDYSKTGMYAKNVTHSISVKNEKTFDKVRLRFNISMEMRKPYIRM